MYDIVLIESFRINAENDIIVTAIVEDMVYVSGSQTYFDPPEYAPARCTIIIPNDDLPDDVNLVDASEKDLENIVNKHIDLDSYDWIVEEEDNSADLEPEYSNLYF